MTPKDLSMKFEEIYGKGTEKLRFFAAPGRVNLIGEHIDYCGGLVFPAALTLGNIVAIRPNGTNTLRFAATDLPGIYEANLEDIDRAKALKWGNYQAGVAKELMLLGCKLVGADLLFDSTLPYGSGLSSSAAIELSTGVALYALSANKDEIALDNVQLSLAGQRAESHFCGVNCGIMDQYASGMGKKDHAILLDCGKVSHQYVPLKLGAYRLVLANTCKKHSLGASKYNERRGEVEKGLAMLHEADPSNKKEHLCDYTEADFDRLKACFKNEPIIQNRVQHVIFENARVKKAAEVLSKGDLMAFGQILKEANDSIRDLYEVTGDELDAMIEAAKNAPGCIGSRMTGAGFGGCTVNIVETAQIDAFIQTVGDVYTKKTGLTPQFYVCSIGDGAREITEEVL